MSVLRHLFTPHTHTRRVLLVVLLEDGAHLVGLVLGVHNIQIEAVVGVAALGEIQGNYMIVYYVAVMVA